MTAAVLGETVTNICGGGVDPPEPPQPWNTNRIAQHNGKAIGWRISTPSGTLIAMLAHATHALSAGMPECDRGSSVHSSAIPAAQSGHSAGCHKLCGMRSRSSRATPCFAANSVIESPRASSVPMATASAPGSHKSKNVPLTADPAVITSFTSAIRFPDTIGCKDFGRRYCTGKVRRGLCRQLVPHR